MSKKLPTSASDQYIPRKEVERRRAAVQRYLRRIRHINYADDGANLLYFPITHRAYRLNRDQGRIDLNMDIGFLEDRLRYYERMYKLIKLIED